MPTTRAYGCLFCLTGREDYVVRYIQATQSDVRALTVRKEKHRSINGQRMTETDIMLPGYVFFEAEAAFDPYSCLRMDAILRVLKTDPQGWQLQGADEEFARFVFARNGLLEMSRAYREGEQIRIISGPLKDMEGRIAKVDRRSKRGRVELDFAGRSFSVWLCFDIVAPQESPPANQ